MKLVPLNKNSIAIIIAVIITLGFFLAGLFEILDYIIVKILLFLSFGLLFVVATSYAIKNDTKKNRPEDKLQDDLH